MVSPISMSFTVDTVSTAMTGLWWNANESGWGVSLTHQADVIFVTMYTYDASDNPTWYVASNCAVSGAGCTGSLYKTAGGQMPTITWNGPVTSDDVGTITLSFTDANSGTMNYTINGVHGSKVITRQVFRATTVGSTTTGGSTKCLASSVFSSDAKVACGSLSTECLANSSTVACGGLSTACLRSRDGVNVACGGLSTECLASSPFSHGYNVACGGGK